MAPIYGPREGRKTHYSLALLNQLKVEGKIRGYSRIIEHFAALMTDYKVQYRSANVIENI